MTSYSTYATSRIRLVDGDLTPEEEQRGDYLDLVVKCLAAGAARALLDTTHDMTDDPEASEQTEVYAEQWHSEEEGWELEAIADDDREPFMAMVREFAGDNLTRVIALAQRLAWDPRFQGELWARDFGMALYRVGQLLGYRGARTGIGFSDYRLPEQDVDVDALDAWVEARTTKLYGWEQSWIDSTEEPCLLHLSA